jgi:hypothetical protein
MKNISSIERVADQALNHFWDHSLPTGFCQSFFEKWRPIFPPGYSSTRNFSTGSAFNIRFPIADRQVDKNIL